MRSQVSLTERADEPAILSMGAVLALLGVSWRYALQVLATRSRWTALFALLVGSAMAVAFANCDGSAPAGRATTLSHDALLDPATCQGCHASHYSDWSGSMHAYASDDPVFVAMNKRMQRETNGAAGTFCVNCHAPAAVREGKTVDGLNLAALPQKLKGVTCYFCHSVSEVTGTHNASMTLATDGIMHGPFADPASNAVHASTYTTLFDRDTADSAKLCGACHDIVNGHGLAMERTYAEWQESVFSSSGGATCGQCHMDQSAQKVSVATGGPLRYYHSHRNPGVDVALTTFPEADTQKAKVQALLDTTLQSALCVGQGGAGISVILDNVAAGHRWPSGSAPDRRAWIEVIAYSGSTVLYKSGVVASGADVTKLTDPDLWLLRDCLFDGPSQVNMLWQGSSRESYTLPAPATFVPTDPRFYQTHILQNFPRTGSLPSAPDRVTLRVRLQPIGFDVLDDLVASGDLDVRVRNAVSVFDVGTAALVEWTPATAMPGYSDGAIPYTCVSSNGLNFTAQTFHAPSHGQCKP